jgi:hypothetical protein
VLSPKVSKKLLIATCMGSERAASIVQKHAKNCLNPCGYHHLLKSSFGNPFVTPLAAFTKPAEIEIIKDHFTKK